MPFPLHPMPFPLHHLLRAALPLSVAACVLVSPLPVRAHDHGHKHSHDHQHGHDHGQGQQRAHTHGHAELDLAIDQRAITLHLSSPLDGFLGFERAPRTDAERRQVIDVMARLKAADRLFQPDPAAGCRLSDVTIDAPVLEPGKPANHEHKHDEHHDHGKHDQHDDHADGHAHADIDLHIVFGCTDAGKARFVDVRLFEAFPRIHSIDAQVASDQGQFRRRLNAKAPRLDWGR